MELANAVSPVAPGLKIMGYQPQVFWQRNTIARQTVRPCVPAAEQCRPARRADLMRCEMLGKDSAPLRESIYVRRLNMLVSGAAKAIGPLLVRHNQNDIFLHS